ncbi:hypothetical protein RHOSPDRAFT_34943 [Rhodotorula sp. JG-1b]|nr:hypothetical protein RHOSPDRAFT_34943 [Rhodotorula sp. JG-1b]
MAASRPAFIFSYNAHDEDVAALVSSSATASTSRQAYAGLGIADSHARARQEVARYSRDDEDDDWVPTYGPTTHRKGKMRFVPARDPQLQTLPGRQEEVATDNDDERAQTEAAPTELAAPRQRAPAGTDIRNLYASIVGLNNKSPTTAPGITQSEPASRRTSPPPLPPPPTGKGTSASPEEARLSPRTKRPRTASPPPVPFEPARGRAVPVFPVREPDIVLSSDSEEEPDDSGAQGGGSSTKNSRRGRPGRGDDDDDGSADEDVDDDVVVIDPLTGLAEERRDRHQNTALRKRVQPLFIHQLLPRASSSSDSDAAAGAPLKPFVPPTQYAIKPDSPGWRLLARQGWREGLPLGPVPAVVAAASPSSDTLDGSPSGDPAAATAGRLKVPLRAVEKHDRSGIGVARAPHDRVVVGALGSEHARRAREERERERRRAEQEAARARRGKGERGMERQRKKEERERKAWIAYMNR